MNLPDDKTAEEQGLRAAAERQIDNFPQDAPLAPTAEEELLHELQAHQLELELQNVALLQAQIALTESRDRYVDLYDFAPVGYITLGAEGMIEQINLTSATLLGRERKKLLQSSFASLVIAEDQERFAQHFLDVKRGDGRDREEFELQRGDGTAFQAQLDCVLQKAAAGRASIGIALTDITERKQAEEARATLEAQLRESQKLQALGTLAGGIAHDFNNVLATILGNVELALQDVGPAHSALESLTEISKASQRAKHLVAQILAFGRCQLMARKLIALAPVVVESARLLRATQPAGVSLNVACAPDLPQVLADAMQIEQMILNLCNNAWQAIEGQSRPGVVEIRLDAYEHAGDAVSDSLPALTPDSLQPGRYACLAVRDNGGGMDEATRGHLFEPFFTTKAVGKGSGLGLSVVLGIAAGHQAVIQVQSKPGEGSTFRIYFPQATAADASIPVEAQHAVSTPATDAPELQANGEHVLYVDDDESIVFLMKRLLERKGFRVSGFTSQEDALAAVRAAPGQFSLAVTDYNMPGMSGLEVARALRQIRADLPIVMVSGYITDEMRAQAPAAGVCELVFKPGTVGALCDAVEHQVQAQRRNQKVG